ncbi:hypothetical protein [Pseudonocardia spirodelae]|uniref:Uncharacterized protein n=1 Tax=Pseudonocardia spirodelae TaxID=3133431 RepID=A0ABU8T3H0_9PSEU
MNDLTTAPAVRPMSRTDLPTHLVNQENAMTLIQEALARSHQQEAQRVAAEYRRARRLTAGRGWSRLATWASARAERARLRNG